MGTLKKILIAILILSAVVFCALFGSLPSFRKTPVGFLNRLIWIKIPGSLYFLDHLATGGRCTWGLQRSGHYLMNENHPLVLIFYMSVVVISECIFVPTAWPRLDFVHRYYMMMLIIWQFVMTYKTVSSVSSVLTPQTHSEHMRQYPYDHVLFRPGQICGTCQFLKPARSKHCRLCNVCVAKHDHHCIWVMNCLGRGNYDFFVGMVLSLGFLLTYGAYLSYILLDDLLQDGMMQRFPGVSTTGHWSDGRSYSKRIDMWAWAFTQDIYVGAVGLLALLTAPLAWGLFIYHVYLIWAGTTTNESFKWDDWKEDIADGLVYKNISPGSEDDPQNGPEIEPEVHWPVACNQRLLNRIHQQRLTPEEDASLQRSGWCKVRSLREVENLYDLGFWSNLRDIFHGSS